MVRIKITRRLRSFNGGTSTTNSRNSSPNRSQVAPSNSEINSDNKGTTNGLVLKVFAVRARNLAAKDRNGTSDPYLILTLGDSKYATHSVAKSLNPDWNVTMQMPVTGINSSLIYCVCWDKDRFGKDYLGEFDIALEDIFSGEKTELEPRWYSLRNKRRGRKKGDNVSGDVLLQFTLFDSTNLGASPAQVLEKFRLLAGLVYVSDSNLPSTSPSSVPSCSVGLVSEDAEEEPSDETDDLIKHEKIEKQKRSLRLRGLRRKKCITAYEFSGTGEVVGIVFLEICNITDLPPERNVTRTSFDMDPFVVASLGKKTHRTRVVRHNLNPVFHEKMIFQVLRLEQAFSFSFTVIDRDKLSGNDFVASSFLPLKEITDTAPEANTETGLYLLKEPETTNSQPIKSRFRIPISRSSSTQDLNKGGSRLANLGQNTSQTNTPTLSSLAVQGPTTGALQPNSAISQSNNADTIEIDTSFHSFALPLKLKNAEKWEEKHSPQLYLKAKYVPYPALRQQFWRCMLRQYDSDENSRISKVELTTMLDTLGSTLKESTIDSWFRCAQRLSHIDEANMVLSFDEAVICLEHQLTEKSNLTILADRLRALASDCTTTQNNISTTTFQSASHVVEIRECPICHQPRLNKRSDADIVTHIATCASQDWQQVNNLVMAGFVTPNQAQRKWYSKVITKISYGGYKLGANSANILVQDRITGQINEERMSVYVRLGIRLLYKGLKSREMEKKRIRKLLKSLSQKQGIKYDDPASRLEIRKFITFHQLDMSEVLLPMEEFRTFNEFFYRQLKPDARPCSAPDNLFIVVSPADCRSVVFNRMDDATRIWVKGREFSIERLLGSAYPEDASRYKNGALGIFRLAPQDYHRFHIPVDGIMGKPKTIQGEYYTVNPMAIRSALDVYGENVRVVIPIDSVSHGRVMVICVGAMMVGSTVITRKEGEQVRRTEELGYFKFGGSTILLLFEEGTMRFDDDLVENSNTALETLVRVGMSIGHHISHGQHTPDMHKKDRPITEKELADANRRIVGNIEIEAVGSGAE
ncbi:phosphatidylserine decarboxylase [Blumeria hordei DH14]|uniref:Phosphatidylserine decarboxylase proenzyme 2 n=1 Tax=Blumeria graminis f. sp. hordei (strain DH14) TaxID=546991 RepID=N1J7U4_BLUG1|nr:phosphatidylserine decarboxylase [Blumeria hordei DH14]